MPPPDSHLTASSFPLDENLLLRLALIGQMQRSTIYQRSKDVRLNRNVWCIDHSNQGMQK